MDPNKNLEYQYGDKNVRMQSLMNNYDDKDEFDPDKYKKFDPHQDTYDMFEKMALDDTPNPLNTENDYDYNEYNYGAGG